MKHTMKKFLAIFLTVTMLFGILPVSAVMGAETNNGNAIYFSLEFYNEEATEKVTQVSAGDCFTIHFNFAGNPAELDDSLHAYQLLMSYDENKMLPDGYFEGVLNTPLQLEPQLENGIALIQGLVPDGLTKRGNVITQGTLFYMYVNANVDLSREDLNAISLLTSAGGKNAYILDGNIPAGELAVVQVPNISVGNVEGKIYIDATKDDVKDMIQSITFIDASGVVSTYTSADAQWADLEVFFPTSGLQIGKNVLTASYNGYACQFEIEVAEDEISSIFIANPPAKTNYTAFEKFDKTGMVVTAIYASGLERVVTAECSVDITTPLKVSDTSWAVTYGDFTVNQPITVEKLMIEVPVASDAVLTYTANVQEFAYSVNADENYVLITGETSGKDAKTYNATASLKDKANTTWKDGSADGDKQLSWVIDKAQITRGLAPMSKKYTTTYAELPSEANIVGVNNENVSATISWYTDSSYTETANGTNQIASGYIGANHEVNLYYKATGMDNYADYRGVVIVSVEDKDVGEILWNTLPNGLGKSGENIVGTYDKAGYTLDVNMFEMKTKNGISLGAPNSLVINKNGSVVEKITDAGTYIVRAVYEDKDNKAEKEFTVLISPKSIEGLKVSLNGIETTATNPLALTYTANAITPSITNVEGLTETDYEIAAENNTTLSATNVVDEEYLIAISGKGNYTGTTYAYWKITPVQISLSGAVVADKVYNGNVDDAVVNSVSFDGLKGEDTLVKGVGYEVVNAVYADKNVGDNVAIDVTVSLKDNVKNYVMATQTITVTGKITKANAPLLSAASAQTLLSLSVVDTAKEYSFNIENIISGVPNDAGAVAYAVKAEGAYASADIEGNVLKVNVAQPKEAGVTDSVVITVSSTNYEDADVTVNFEFKNKISVEIELDNASVVYNGEPQAVVATYANQPQSGYTWTYQYTGIEGTVYDSNEAPVNAGKYSVTARYEDNTPDQEYSDIPGHVGEKSAILVIDKKPLALADGTVVITKVYDGNVSAGTLTGALAVIGAVNDDEVFVDMTFATVSEYGMADVGIYSVEVGGFVLGGAHKDNYTIQTSYNFDNAKITKKQQDAVTINESNEEINVAYKDALNIVLGGGNGTGAYTLISSDPSILKLNVVNENTWSAEALKVGTVTLTASKLGDNNYEDSLTTQISCVIAPKNIAESDFVFDLDNKVYTASAITTTIISDLVVGVDYEPVYTNNIAAGTAIVTVNGIGNYTGSVSKTFEITSRALNETEFAVTGIAQNYTYTGTPIIPEAIVKWDNILLIKDVDYNVSYSNNENVGDATVTITGIGNYTASIDAAFVITAAAYTGTIAISANQSLIESGTVLTANVSAATGHNLSYQWKRNGENIDNATSDTYTLTSEDINANISVAVTSVGNYIGTLESEAINVGKSVLTANVSIVNTEGVITATVTDAPSENDYTVVWLRDGNQIENATGLTYTVTNADKGCGISVSIVAKGDIYTGTVVSNTIAIPAEAPVFESIPSASAGNAQITVSFAAAANGSAILNYEIIVDGSVVATVSGDQNSYTITNLTNGTQYTVKVAAINAVGRTESGEVNATPYISVIYGGGGGGGGSSSSKKVSVNETSGGKISTNVKSASAGSKVVVAVTPEKGYKLSEVIVRDKNGNVISVTIDGLNATFTMPKTEVTIEPIFVKEETSEEEKPEDTEAVTVFSDVPSNAYYSDAVNWAVKNKITSGTAKDLFSPEEECSRAQMVTFLWRAAGSPKAQKVDVKFADITRDSYYYDAVIWAVENGITSGVSETSFSPDEQVSRAQTVTFLWRLANSPSTDIETGFGDIDEGSYYDSAVKWAVSEQVTNGVSDESFGPGFVCTRAQIVTFIYRYFVK